MPLRRGIEIVRTYADEGKSGLRLDGRDALKQLIEDVQTGKADFRTILVYDVSRWGRFQDADESAYYEYICKRAGISVQYCAEQFENDGSPVSTIVKGVKRAMAGEYSRELSVKVFAGQCRLIELGYRQGGPPGFGLRRSLVDQAGAAKASSRRGEHKSIQTDRVVLIPGPPRRSRRSVGSTDRSLTERKPEREIADALNERGVQTDLGRPWTRGTVHQVLINEKYIGNNVWNRVSFKLKQKARPQQSRTCGSAPRARSSRSSTDRCSTPRRQSSASGRYGFQMKRCWRRFKRLLQDRGYLSGLIIDESRASAVQQRLSKPLWQPAARLSTWSASRPTATIATSRSIGRFAGMHPQIVTRHNRGNQRSGRAWSSRIPTTDLLTVNGEFTASIVVVRCLTTPLRVRFAGKSGSTPACGPTSPSRFAWTSRTRTPSTTTFCRAST